MLVGDSRLNQSVVDYGIVEYAGAYNGEYLARSSSIKGFQFGGTINNTAVQYSLHTGLLLYNSTPMTITGLIARSNTVDGVSIEGSSKVRVMLSNLFNNGTNLRASADAQVDARRNYWGSVDGPGATIVGDVPAIPFSARRFRLYEPVITATAAGGGAYVRPGIVVSLQGRDFDCVATCRLKLYWDVVGDTAPLHELDIVRTSRFSASLRLPSVISPGTHEIIGVLYNAAGIEIARGSGSVELASPVTVAPFSFPKELIPGEPVTVRWRTRSATPLQTNRLVWDTISRSSADDYAHEMPNQPGVQGDYQATFTPPETATTVFFRVIVSSPSGSIASAEYAISVTPIEKVDIGSLTIWADDIQRTRTGGFTFNTNVAIGANGVRHFSVKKLPTVTGPELAVTAAGALSGDGTIAFANGTRRVLLAGPFTGKSTTGEIVPAAGVDKLLKLANINVADGSVQMLLQGKTGLITGQATLKPGLAENEHETIRITFGLHDTDEMTGTFSQLELDAAGMLFTLAAGTVDRNGLRSPRATLKLPPHLGGGTATVNGIRITGTGPGELSFDEALIHLPRVTFGGPGVLEGRDINARLVVDGPNFAVTGDGILHVGLPGNEQDLDVTFQFVRDGDNTNIRGTIAKMELDLAGARLVMSNIVITNDGLSSQQVEIFAPTILAQDVNAKATLGNVRITRAGLFLDNAHVVSKIPDIRIGELLALSGMSGTFDVDGDGYRLNLVGKLSLALPGISSEGPVTFSLRRNATSGEIMVDGTVSTLTLNIAGGTLKLDALRLTNAGLSVQKGTLTLPSAGLTNAVVNNVVIRTSNCTPEVIGPEGCLSIGDATAGFSLPDVSIGGAGSVFAFTAGKGRLTYSDGLLAVMVDGIITAALPGNTGTRIGGTMFIAPDGAVSGTVRQFSVQLAGGLQIDVDTGKFDDKEGLSAEQARLRLPDALGGAGIGVERLRFDLRGLPSIGGGEFELPSINTGIGGFRITGAKGSLSVQNVNGEQRYVIKGKGVFAIDFLAELTISFSITYTSLNNVLLDNACLGIRSLNPSLPGVPLGPAPPSPLFITGISGCVDLSPEVTTFNLKLTVEALPQARIAGYSPLWGTVSAQYKTAGDPAITLAGAIYAYAFQLASAEVTIARTVFDIDVKAEVSIAGGVVTGSFRAHMWHDGSLHFVGSADARIQGSAVPVVGKVLGNVRLGVRLEFGEFRDDDVTRSGLKGVLEVAKAKGYVFVGIDGHIEGGWGAGDLVLLDQAQLRQALRGAGPQANGLLGEEPFSAVVGPDATTATFTRAITRTTPLLFDLQWKAGDPTLQVLGPNGQPVDLSSADVRHVRETGHELVLVGTPAAGTWTITIGNLQGNEDFQLETRSFYQQRTIQSATVTGTDKPVVSWTLSPGENDPTVSIWVEREDADFASAFAGERVADNVAGTTFALTTTGLVSGTYRAYVQLDDGQAGLERKYAAGTFRVVNAGPPAAPERFTAHPVAEGLELRWQPPADQDVGGYRIVVSAGPAFTETETITIGTRDADDGGLVHYLLRQPGGQTRRVTVQAIDIDGLAGPAAGPVTATTASLIIETLAPASGSIGIARTTPFSVTFNLDLDPTSVVTANVRMRDSRDAEIDVKVGPLSLATEPERIIGLLITPTTTLLEGEPYTLTIRGGLGGVRSTNGRTLGGSARTTFVTAAAAPVAGFTMQADLIAGTPFTVTNTTTGPGRTTYNWDFGDGGRSDAANPSYTYQAAGAYTVTLTANGPGGTTTASRQVHVVEQDATASLIKTGRMAVDADGDGKLTPGDTVEWTVTLRNTGAATLANWTITDLLDSNTTLVAGSSTTTQGAVSVTGNTVRAVGPALVKDTTAVLTLRTIVNADVAVTVDAITNQASLAADNHPSIDSDDPVTGATADATRMALARPAVASTLIKTGRLLIDADQDGKLTPGDTIEWTITLASTGSSALLNWSLTDVLDANTTLVPDSATSTAGTVGVVDRTVSVNGATLAAGGSAVLSIRTVVNANVAATVGVIANQASLAATNHPTLQSDDPDTPAPVDATHLILDRPATPPQKHIYLPRITR